MRKVAIIADGWKKYINYAWVGGCRQYIADHNCDMNLYFFNSFGNYSLDEKYNLGEYNIFHLPDLRTFDGIILELTNISDVELKQRIIARVEESGVPTVSLLEDIPQFYYVGTNNYATMKKMVNHLIEVHGCKTLNFIAGPEENCESMARLSAYRDALREHGIPCEESRIYFANFEIDTGVEAFEYFYQNGLMPEVFVCANDNIAVGVCQQAQSKGLYAPKDFLVTGYDNFDKASYYSPRITTAGFIREEIAYAAMDKLHAIWGQGDTERVSLIEARCIFQESCGCVNPEPTQRGKYVNDRIMLENSDRKISNEMLLLKRELINCNSFQEMMTCIPNHLTKLNCDEMYILVNQEIADCNELPQLDAAGEEEYRTEGYPDCLDVLLACAGDKVLDFKTRKPGELVPGGEDSSSGNLYLFSPLHFRDREVGYVVFKNCDYLMSQMLFEALNVIAEAMENMYHRIILNKMNQELSKLYIRDSLTGMYNRMAYQKLAVPLFERCRNAGEALMIMFVDLDRLKYINDTFGHDMGNIAIRAIATAIMNCCPDDGIAMRYGGDEFVILIPNYDKQKAERFVKKLNREISMERSIHNTGFCIEASMGYVITTDEPTMNMNDYINQADERMYEVKKAKKANRTT